jgi:hypothetical protein
MQVSLGYDVRFVREIGNLAFVPAFDVGRQQAHKSCLMLGTCKLLVCQRTLTLAQS